MTCKLTKANSRVGGRPSWAAIPTKHSSIYTICCREVPATRAPLATSLTQVLDATERLLSQCDCAQSCYRCIRHYRNNYIHASLDRHLALALLRHIRQGIVPTMSKRRMDRWGGGADGTTYNCAAFLSTLTSQSLASTCPMIVRPHGREVWIDFHHALVDPDLAPSAVALKARAQFTEFVAVDVFTLAHDLPSAVARLGLKEGVSS